MQNATSKNKLNLSGVWVKWLMIQDLKPILHSSKCPLNSNSKAGVSEIKQLMCSPRIVPIRELVEMVPGFPEGWKNTRPTCIANISKVELVVGDVDPIRSTHDVTENVSIMC